MAVENELKCLILAKYKSIRAFTTENRIPYSTVDNIFKRGIGSIGVSTATKVCSILNIDLDALMEGRIQEKETPQDRAIESLPEDAQKHMELYQQLSAAGRQAADDNVFTLLMFQQAMEKQAVKVCDTRIDELATYRSLRKSDQAFSAGLGVYLGPEAFDLIRVKDNELTRRATFCGAVDGNSMEPRYHDGNILLVNSDEEVEVGEIGIFTLDGHGYVKKRGRGELISLNPNYAPIPLDDSIRCNGKVIGILNPEWIVED